MSLMTLDQLKRSRTSRKTIIRKLLEDMKDAVDSNNQLETERCLAHLELKEAKLYEIAQQLENATTDDSELDQAILENESFSEQIIDAKILAHRLLATARNSRVPTSTTGTFSAPSAVKSIAKLPKLQIRKFEGILEDWERFWDQFKAGVDDNPTLSNVDKFNYLKGLLTENASLTIAGLSLTAANYDIATGLLKQKYGQTEILIAEHVRQLLEVRKIHKIDNGQELRLMLESFQTHVRALENLGKSVASMGTLLCPTLLKALPHPMIREWHRQTIGKTNDNLKLLLDFIRIEIEGVELACRNNASSASKEVRKPVKTENSFTTASTLVTTGGNTGNSSNGSGNTTRQKFPCIFCASSQHFASRCPEFKTREERSTILKKQGRCFRCLKRGHTIQQCDSTYRCFKCQQIHHTSLCNKRTSNRGESNRQSSSNEKEETSPKFVAHTTSQEAQVSKTLVASTGIPPSSKSLSVLQTLRVWVKHKGGRHRAVILLDGGSEKSFINQSLSRKLQLPEMKMETLTVHSFGGKTTTQQSKRVEVSLVGNNDNCLDVSLLEVPEISTSVRLWENSKIEAYLSTHNMRYNWNQAMGPGEKVSIDILIGADLYWAVVTGHMKRLSALLMATETIFGWTLQGNVDNFGGNKHTIAMFIQTESAESDLLDTRIAQLWELDKSGVMSQEEKSTRTLQEIEVLDFHQKTTVFVEGRYQVNIPWNKEKLSLCNNYALAKQRLKGLLMHLQKNPPLLERYRNGIYEYLRNGHTEEVFSLESHDALFHMPHHPIVKEDRKTTKLRIVFDASSHDSTGKSLNQCQYTGANLNPTIFDILLRFRTHKVAIASDIEKAFLQISLRPEDRDATRFLWTDSVWEKDKEPPLKIFRMTRVLFGMKSSPYLLAATIRHHLALHAEEYPVVSALIDKNIYVDDLISGASNTEQAFVLSVRAKELMDKANMPLKKWATNDASLREKWILKDFISLEEPVELLKVLGLMWNPMEDKLFFKTANLQTALKDCQPTKRSILEILARVFDPLGFLTPKLISLKILLQELWRAKIPWDEELPDPFKATWENWTDDIGLLEEFQVDRWYGTVEDASLSIQLHIFCDTSMRAYGAVAFLRILSNDHTKTILVSSKSRVAPLKLMSVPRLELLACVLGARLANSLLQAWNSKMDTFLWTDSLVALQWIQSSPGKWKIFVARRIQEIQELTSSCKWKYCHTKDNPADILSRGTTLKVLLINKLWWQGPKWLNQATTWEFEPLPSNKSNLESMAIEENHSLLVTTEIQEDIFDPTRFSTWRKIVRVTAWIIRFLQNCHKKNKHQETFLTIKEIQNAEKYWIRQMQFKSFPEEMHRLKENLAIKTTSPLYSFQPFLDRAGVMRMSGRIQFANLSHDQTHPVLLKGGGILDWLVLDRHEKVLHGGIQSTLIKIREEIWILKGRQVVRSAIRKCLVCRKWTAKPTSVIEAPLPEARINRSLPFEITGIDFAGPVWVKISNEKAKAYICLFTCAVTRGLHLELTLSQNIKHFLWALRRFVARRGGCKLIFSDNGATFSQADRLLQEALQDCRHPELQEWRTQHNIEWRFIPPRACWWGGFYERMVGTVKRHLRRTLGTSLMVPDELATLLTEIEAVVNARPLTALSEDFKDMEPLTPSHFLIGQAGNPLVDILPLLNTNPVKPALLKKWNYRKRLMDNFWKHWTKEYLLQLQSAHRLKVPLIRSTVQIGDVVLLKEPRLPRGQWRMARIEELYEGRDGNIRSVLLRTAAGTPLRRAVQDICPLEVIKNT